MSAATRIANRRGIDILETDARTVVQHQPREYMTPEEEIRFDRAVESVGRATRAGTCRFESRPDGEDAVRFNYAALDGAPPNLLDNIRLIVESVGSGRAVRIETPGAGVIITPRWNPEWNF